MDGRMDIVFSTDLEMQQTTIIDSKYSGKVPFQKIATETFKEKPTDIETTKTASAFIEAWRKTPRGIFTEIATETFKEKPTDIETTKTASAFIEAWRKASERRYIYHMPEILEYYGESISNLKSKTTIKEDLGVKIWLNSDITLKRTVRDILNEINVLSNVFDIKINSIELKRERDPDLPEYEEIVMKIRVPKEMNIQEIDKFWNRVGEKVAKIIDEIKITNPQKADEINEKILVIVNK